MADVPPVGYATYLLHPDDDSNVNKVQNLYGSSNMHAFPPKNIQISNDHLTVEFDKTTGFISQIIEGNGQSHSISASVWWYNSSDGLDSKENRGQSSGAYIFRPNGKFQASVDGPISERLEIIHGSEVSEVRLVINDWTSLVT